MVPRKNRSAAHLFALLLSQGKFENGCYVDALTYHGRVITGDAGCSGINCRKDGEEPRPSSTHIQWDIEGFMKHNLGLFNGMQWFMVEGLTVIVVVVGFFFGFVFGAARPKEDSSDPPRRDGWRCCVITTVIVEMIIPFLYWLLFSLDVPTFFFFLIMSEISSILGWWVPERWYYHPKKAGTP